MPDIIEQLEAGKKLQEEEGIDVKSLRTKIGSNENGSQEKPKQKRERKKKESNENIEVNNKKINKEENIIDPFVQAEQIINELNTKKEINNNEANKINKPEKYPGFNFNNTYAKGQKIFYLKIHEKLGIKEIMELKIRTVYEKTIVACLAKGHAVCIGPDTADKIFLQRKDAVKVYNDTNIKSIDNNIDYIENLTEEN